jgi:hypothetical protein
MAGRNIKPVQMSQQVRPNTAELRSFASRPQDVGDGLAGEFRLALRDKQPGQIILPGGEVPFDGAELVPGLTETRMITAWVLGRENGGNTFGWTRVGKR